MEPIQKWGDKPYFSLDYYYKETFHHKVYKLSLNGGFTCPNRDGTLDTRGCIFCSAGGSGDFAANVSLPIDEQIKQAKQLVLKKIKQPDEARYIAYFQAFTNTYAPLEYLQKVYETALHQPQVVGLAIGTRPDCLSDETISYLAQLNQKHPIYVELGLQTISEDIARYIRRGYNNSVFEDAVRKLHDHHIPVVVHIIIGLPGETTELLLDTIKYLNRLPISGIKIAMLHILKGTDLARDYEKALQTNTMQFPQYTLEQYCDTISLLISHIRPDIVIHRLTGDGPKTLLIDPLWTANKRQVLNTLHKTLIHNNIYQGIHWKDD